jgi:hypothetical protein
MLWKSRDFDLTDSLNQTIWSKSPKLQRALQSPEDLLKPGSVGSQQAMIEEDPELNCTRSTVLPWIPDLVGMDYKDGGVLIVGSSYPGLIEEYSGGPLTMPLRYYLFAAGHAEGASIFQQQFLRQVVDPDQNHYGPIGTLMDGVGMSSSQIALTNLCLNSVVQRKVVNGRRQDSGKQPCKRRAEAFCLYSEHPTVAGWHWQRIQENTSGVILALGHLAEHGLIRLFQQKGATVSCGYFVLPPSLDPSPSRWVDRYASLERKLSWWLAAEAWWTITLGDRTWFILPIYHPINHLQYDPSYARTIEVLKKLLDSAGFN